MYKLNHKLSCVITFLCSTHTSLKCTILKEPLTEVVSCLSESFQKDAL